MMSYPNRSWHILLMTMLALGIVHTVADAGYGQKKDEKKKKDSSMMTEAELQSHLMGFADRFAAYVIARLVAKYFSKRMTHTGIQT